MSNEDTQVVDSAETTTDLEVTDTSDARTSESEAPTEAESGEQHATETAEQRSARLKRQIERAAKQAGKSVEEFLGLKGQESSKESGQKAEDVSEKFARLELKQEGITSKKAQDVVLEYAAWKGIDPTEALKSPAVRAELAELEKKAAAPAPSKRTNGGASDSFEYWVAQARKGNFPTHDREMMLKLKKARIFTS